MQFSTDEVKRLSKGRWTCWRRSPTLTRADWRWSATTSARCTGPSSRPATLVSAALAFIAGTSKFADWFTLGRKLQPDDTTRVYRELGPFDPIAHLPKVTAKAVLLQFASKDPGT